MSVAAGVAVSIAPAPASAIMGADRFFAGQQYSGEFGSPSLIMVGNEYYAFATNTDGHNLPVMHSSDLSHWYARSAYDDYSKYSSWKGYNDAFPHPASWAYYTSGGGRRDTRVWAPSVAFIGNAYVLAYAVAVSPSKMCLSIATAANPDGPYRDDTTKPIVCSSQPGGSIDPQLYSDDAGHWYLMWKNSGQAHVARTAFWTRRLTADGTALQPGTRAHELLVTAQRWEGNVIEGPSMAHWGGRWYLLYSANLFQTANYAIGYAICRSPMGPCRRPTNHPLLATGNGIAGPGVPAPLVDQQGQFRMGYSAWREGHVGYATDNNCLGTPAGCNQRRMYIATIGITGRGLLTVLDRG